MSDELFKSALALLEKRLQEEPLPSIPPSKTEYDGLHLAAAVLDRFDPATLRPYLPLSTSDDEARYELLEDSFEIREGSSLVGWSLTETVRRAALRQLGSVTAVRSAMQTNQEQSSTVLQKMYAAVLTATVGAIDLYTQPGLIALKQISVWLAPDSDGTSLVAGVVVPTGIDERLALIDLLAPLQKLAGDCFMGRTSELSTLRNYVGVLSPDSVGQAVVQGFRKLFSLRENVPLMIYGPGGIGKSTLVGKFILEHALLPQSRRFPFAYLDFDQAHVKAAEPVTLLVEAARQIGIQYPDFRSNFESVRSSWLAEISSRGEESASTRSRHHEILEDRFIEDFLRLLKIAKLDDLPLLFVLDTFEEVQRRSKTYVSEVFSFLERLQQALGSPRIVISGRSQVRDFKTQELCLSAFDELSAIGFLKSRGISDLDARALFERLGGSPLSLNLGATLWRMSTSDVSSVKTRNRWSFKKLSDETIQGALYRRILDHIEDEDIRRLASPGLIVRRITPNLIRHVLAGPCGIIVESDDKATDLFNRLANEVALVEPGDIALLELNADPQTSVTEAHTLRHRTDLRKIMVRLLLRDKADAARKIQEAAIEYYLPSNEPVKRAEEIYHRLMLNQDDELIRQRWIPGVEPFLFDAADELRPNKRATLESLLGLDSSAEVLAASGLESWEISTAKTAKESLRVGQPEAALTALRARSERSPASPLFAIETQVLNALGSYAEAVNVAQFGQASAIEAGDEPLAADLACHCGEAYLRLGLFADADSMLSESDDLLRNHPECIRHRLWVALYRLQAFRLQKQNPSNDHVKDSVDRFESYVTNGVEDVDTNRLAGWELGQLDRTVLATCLRRVGLSTTNIRLYTKFLEFINAWIFSVTPLSSRQSAFQDLIGGRPVQAIPPQELAVILGDYLARAVLPRPIMIGLAALVGDIDDEDLPDIYASTETSPGPIDAEYVQVSPQQADQVAFLLQSTFRRDELESVVAVNLNASLASIVGPNLDAASQSRALVRWTVDRGVLRPLLRAMIAALPDQKSKDQAVQLSIAIFGADTANQKSTTTDVIKSSEALEAVSSISVGARISRGRSLFVSYAHSDERDVEAMLSLLRSHLQAAKGGPIELWRDRDILVGENWDNAIQESLVASTAGLLLTSPAYFASSYIGKFELPHLLSGVKPIIPIALRRFEFDLIDTKGVERHQIFFLKGKAFAELGGKQRQEFVDELFSQIMKRLG